MHTHIEKCNAEEGSSDRHDEIANNTAQKEMLETKADAHTEICDTEEGSSDRHDEIATQEGKLEAHESKMEEGDGMAAMIRSHSCNDDQRTIA